MHATNVAAAFLYVAYFAAALSTSALAGPVAGTIPAGTRLRFHLVAPVSSNMSKTGDIFAFVLLDPIVADGRVVAPAGATGSGTVYLAGHAGTSGHEGDLTLRLDSIPADADRLVTFDDQRFPINGRNRKIQSGVLGFVPFVGIGAMFIRGSEIRIDATTSIETVLLRDATIAAAPRSPALPSLSPAPSPSPSPS